MENHWFEFNVGLYVEAQTDEDAFRMLAPVLEAANKLDPEGDAQVELVGTWPLYGPQARRGNGDACSAS